MHERKENAKGSTVHLAQYNSQQGASFTQKSLFQFGLLNTGM